MILGIALILGHIREKPQKALPWMEPCFYVFFVGASRPVSAVWEPEKQVSENKERKKIDFTYVEKRGPKTDLNQNQHITELTDITTVPTAKLC